MSRRLRIITVLSMLVFAACRGPVPLAEMNIPFTGESIMGKIAGEPYRFFRYETEEAVQADVAKIAPDGKKIGGKRMRWEGPVHFYYIKKRIVVYVGSHPTVLRTIEDVFGPQIAGED